eukprot:2530644-Amphidinium_carterae.1
MRSSKVNIFRIRKPLLPILNPFEMFFSHELGDDLLKSPFKANGCQVQFKFQERLEVFGSHPGKLARKEQVSDMHQHGERRGWCRPDLRRVLDQPLLGSSPEKFRGELTSVSL